MNLRQASVCLSGMLLWGLTAVAQAGPPAPPAPPNPMVASQDEAGAAVQRAYDGVSRTTSLGQISSVGNVSVSNLISQSKSFYQEALSSYRSGDYVGAREYAMASTDLSHAVEEASMSADAMTVAGLSSPPAVGTDPQAAARASQDIENLQYRLTAMSNTPSATAISGGASQQSKAMLAEAEQLRQLAQNALTQNRAERAVHLAHAGDALTHVAEHIENRYLIAAGITPTPPAPNPAGPPPPPGGAVPPPPPPPQ